MKGGENMDKNDKPGQQLPGSVNLNLDTTPVLYTDNVFMSTNEDGVVLDVAQRVGGTDQLRVVSRIGMSRQHAKKLVQKLGELLVVTEGNQQTGKKVQN